MEEPRSTTTRPAYVHKETSTEKQLREKRLKEIEEAKNKPFPVEAMQEYFNRRAVTDYLGKVEKERRRQEELNKKVEDLNL